MTLASVRDVVTAGVAADGAEKKKTRRALVFVAVEA